MDKIKIIIEKRIQRIFRLFLLSNTYSHFTKSILYSAIIKHDNNYVQAEKTADLFNFIFSNEYCVAKPSNFLHDKNEMADKSIYHYSIYRKFIDRADESYFEWSEIEGGALDAFCKSVEFGYKENKKYNYDCIMLKSLGHVQLSNVLSSCILYASGDIDLIQFQREFVWLGYSMKLEPVNIRMLVTLLNKMDRLYYKILTKQIERRIKKYYMVALQN